MPLFWRIQFLPTPRNSFDMGGQHRRKDTASSAFPTEEERRRRGRGRPRKCTHTHSPLPPFASAEGKLNLGSRKGEEEEEETAVSEVGGGGGGYPHFQNRAVKWRMLPGPTSNKIQLPRRPSFLTHIRLATPLGRLWKRRICFSSSCPPPLYQTCQI